LLLEYSRFGEQSIVCIFELCGLWRKELACEFPLWRKADRVSLETALPPVLGKEMRALSA